MDGAPKLRKCGYLLIRENLVITWPYADRPSSPQGNQCLLLHFLASLGTQEKTNCTSMLWSIDSCQNRISTDQYHMTALRAQVSTHRDRVLFWSYPLTNYQFQLIAGSKLVFFPMIHMKSVVFMSLWPSIVKILISNWPRTRIQNQSIPPAPNTPIEVACYIINVYIRLSGVAN